MLKYIFFILSFCIFSIGAQCQSKLEEVNTFGENPGNLNMWYYQPDSISENTPIVIALHGCTQNALEFAQQTGWNKLADHFGFVVLYPEQKVINNMSRCFNWFLERDFSGDNGESASIIHMLEYLKDKKGLKSKNVFVYGLSAGGAMGIALMAEYPDQFKVGAVMGCGPYRAATNPIKALQLMVNPIHKSVEEWKSYLPNQGEELPVLIVGHGTEDDVVPPDNAKELLKQWCPLDSLSVMNISTDSSFNGNKNVEKIYYQHKSRDLIFYKFKGVGHAVPVQPGSAIDKGGQIAKYAVDIGYHSTYFFALDFGLVRSQQKK